MNRELIIGLMLTLGSASTIAICSAETGSAERVTEQRLEGTGCLYTGEINIQGEPNGEGTLYLPDGIRREGTWVSGQLTQGTEYDIDGHKTYTGGWILDAARNLSVRHGIGVKYWESGKEKLIGTWEHGRFTKGMQKSETGALLYDGSWEFDSKTKMYVYHGQGIKYYYPEGGRYEGNWQFGKRHGKGTLFWSDGSKRIDGTWENDIPNGRITAYYRGGEVKAFSGYMKNGKIDTEYQYFEWWISGKLSHHYNPYFKGHKDRYYGIIPTNPVVYGLPRGWHRRDTSCHNWMIDS